MEEFFYELYQLMFILSITYVVFISFSFIVKTIAVFYFKKETPFILKTKEKIIFWFSLSIILTYLI